MTRNIILDDTRDRRWATYTTVPDLGIKERELKGIMTMARR